ncbi:hypothetical protein ACFX2C_024320 [Malus domestica]
MVDFGKKQHRTLNITVDLASIHIDALDVVSGNGHEHAIVYIGTSQGVYGARATINVWSPLIEHTHVRTKAVNVLHLTESRVVVKREVIITEVQALGVVIHSQGPLFGGVQRNMKSSSDNVVVC